jgi:hypothetical protein
LEQPPAGRQSQALPISQASGQGTGAGNGTTQGRRQANAL